MHAMVQRLPAGYVFDPADPRSPSAEQWDAMTPEERRAVVKLLSTWEELERSGLTALLQKIEELERQKRELQAELARLKGEG
jgi:hypothetical protein